VLNEEAVIDLYVNERYTLRMVAREFDTNHHKIKRVLEKNGIEITQKGRKREPFSDAHRRKIGEASKGRRPWSQGIEMTREHSLKNMRAHLKYDVTLEWLEGFPEIEKLKYLNHSITRRRDYEGFSTETYIQFIEKFYYDDKFNKLFLAWKETGDRWMKPSLDHIQAKCNGGSLLLENMQFISWFENRAKADIDQATWESMKGRISEYF
jgi:hypothetical protein